MYSKVHKQRRPLYFSSATLAIVQLIGWLMDGASISSFTPEPHTLPTIRTKYDAALPYDGKPNHHPAAAMATWHSLHGTHLGKIDSTGCLPSPPPACRCGGYDGDVSTKMY